VKIQIDGVGKFEVSDEFRQMPPDQQQAIMGHIAEQAGKGIKSGMGLPDMAPAEPQAEAQPRTFGDLDRQIGAGAIEGAATALFPPSAANLMEKGADWLWNKVMPAGPAGPRPTGWSAPGGMSEAAAGQMQQWIDAVTAQAGAPADDKEAIARRVGTYLGGGAVGGTGPVRSLLGAGGDIIAGKLTEGTPYETPARVIGGILGSSVPGVVAKAATTPVLKISPERQAAVQTLEQANVPVMAGESSGNPTLRYAEATLGGNKAREIKANQGEALAKEVMGRAGSPGELMTRENMEKGFDRLGKTYQDIGTRNDLKFDTQFAQDLNNVTSNYENSVHIANNKPTVYREVAKVYDAAVGGGGMSGIQYQNWRSQLGKGVNTLYKSGDEGSAQALKDLRGALDSAFARSVKNPEDAALLKETNRQYSAMKGVQKGIERAGGDPILGLLGQNPAATLRAMATGTKGHRGFTDLADAAGTLLKPLPDSGTAQRLNQLGTVASTVYDLSHGHIPITAIGKMVAGKLIGRGLMSDWFQNYLKNQTPSTARVGLQRGLLPAFAANQGILSQLPYSGQ
jgi:hypothetical protein